MKYAMKLAIFMDIKRDEIVAAVGYLYSEYYLVEEDIEELLELPEERAEYIYNLIKSAIDDGVSGLDASVCPFCYMVDICEACQYEKMHKKCSTRGSDYDKLVTELKRVGHPAREILSNEFYRNVIKNMEEGRYDNYASWKQ